MQLRFHSTREAEPGAKWKALFDRSWPAYHAWFLREGEAKRPTYAVAAKALARAMPELVPLWNALVALAGGGDHAARLLSLYRPPPYLTGCSQAVWTRDEPPMLVRNYDYHPDLTEGTLLYSAWHGTRVIAMSDCLWGVLDGLNEHGLALSLSFGGRQVVGDGFGAPLVLRYALEFCKDTREAVAALERVPSHMAYNVTIADAGGDHASVQVAPDRPPLVSRDCVATNHQGEVSWTAHAVRTATVERQLYLNAQLDDPALTKEEFVRSFLTAPLFHTDYAQAFGTLYTAAYETGSRAVHIVWPGQRWRRSFENFEETTTVVEYTPRS